MSKLMTIRAYEYSELNEKAKNNFIDEMWNNPFETGRHNADGKMIIEYDYFGEWDLEEQIYFCEINSYLFDKYGNLVKHLEEVSDE